MLEVEIFIFIYFFMIFISLTSPIQFGKGKDIGVDETVCVGDLV